MIMATEYHHMINLYLVLILNRELCRMHDYNILVYNVPILLKCVAKIAKTYHILQIQIHL